MWLATSRMADLGEFYVDVTSSYRPFREGVKEGVRLVFQRKRANFLFLPKRALEKWVCPACDAKKWAWKTSTIKLDSQFIFVMLCDYTRESTCPLAQSPRFHLILSPLGKPPGVYQSSRLAQAIGQFYFYCSFRDD